MAKYAVHVFCDESGNTGLDLFNKEQPLFSLASTCIEPQAAEALLGPLRMSRQKEVKYSSARRTHVGQRALLDFFSSPLLQPDNSAFTLTDKKFYLISHLVDKLIEPPLHEHGIDLSERDAHVGLARVWFYTGHTIFQHGHWRKVLEAFLAAIRRLDQTSFDRFDAVLTRAMKATAEDSRDFAVGLYLARGRLKEFIGIYSGFSTFDPAVDAFSLLVNHWMRMHKGEFRLTHDRSKPLKKSEGFIRTLMTPVAPRQIGFGKRQNELPLRLSSLEFGDSQAHPQIQVADVIAGAAVDGLLTWSGIRPNSDYHEKLKATKLDTLFAGGMLPSPSLEPSEPPKPGEVSLPQGAADFLKEVGYFDKR